MGIILINALKVKGFKSILINSHLNNFYQVCKRKCNWGSVNQSKLFYQLYLLQQFAKPRCKQLFVSSIKSQNGVWKYFAKLFFLFRSAVFSFCLSAALLHCKQMLVLGYLHRAIIKHRGSISYFIRSLLVVTCRQPYLAKIICITSQTYSSCNFKTVDVTCNRSLFKQLGVAS